jgi:hypothetical protein
VVQPDPVVGAENTLVAEAPQKPNTTIMSSAKIPPGTTGNATVDDVSAAVFSEGVPTQGATIDEAVM